MPAPKSARALWPDEARLVVVVTVLIENWSEGQAPPYSPMTTAPKPGVVDLAGVTWATYGGRAGAWRLMRILGEHRVPATFCVNGRSAELYEDLMRQIVASGHEVAAHGYHQNEVLSVMPPDEEREVIRRCAQIVKRVTGKRATGWLSPTLATTVSTTDLVAAEGYLWHGDYNYLDLPCRIRTKNGTMVAIPHSDFADHRVLRAAPSDWFNAYKDMFDYMYAKEEGGFINITLHGNFGGRPLIAAIFDQLLTYIRGFPGVWMPRHDELAKWVMAQGIDEVTYQQRFYPDARAMPAGRAGAKGRRKRR